MFQPTVSPIASVYTLYWMILDATKNTPPCGVAWRMGETEAFGISWGWMGVVQHLSGFGASAASNWLVRRVFEEVALGTDNELWNGRWSIVSQFFQLGSWIIPQALSLLDDGKDQMQGLRKRWHWPVTGDSRLVDDGVGTIGLDCIAPRSPFDGTLMVC
ncbi:hypothetical protein BOTBODRAFT_26236 [Botryobasidium botryosum FD-172 SS1]|uniref:Uncharacterized protein n=1 Tax=Botryobasidium botryosum (strain FD-172 SS1) TaxID=930990 RepID=A0A067N1Y6_BOTB1|nr:hypothetical protein BOTBODRAFT_26236 [Botryobasidium botryosum FD-172 SS1]